MPRLSQLERTRSISIDSLAVPEPQSQRYYFNPEIVVSESDWKQLCQGLIKMRLPGNINMKAMVSMASELATVFPNRRNELDVREDDMAIIEPRLQLDRLKRGAGTSQTRQAILWDLAELRPLMPKVVDKMVGDYVGGIMEELKVINEYQLLFDDQTEVINSAIYLSLVMGEKVDLILSDDLEEFIGWIVKRLKTRNWKSESIVEDEALIEFIRLFTPHIWEEIQPTSAGWGHLLNTLNEYLADENFLSYANHLKIMALLGARHVSIGPKGWELIFDASDDKSSEQLQAIPIQRSF